MNAPSEFTQQQKSAAFEFLKNTDFGSNEANLNALIIAQQLVELNKKRELPALNDGEIYLFGITMQDGKTAHTILLSGDNDDASWKKQMAWAKSIGGDLLDRAELAICHKYFSHLFQKDFYWSNTLHAEYSAYAWSQDFGIGVQYGYYVDRTLRARAVRRLVI